MAVLAPGEVLGDYRVERVLGGGGMGVVYLARHLVLQRPAAVKVIAPGLAQDAAFRSRFERESRAVAGIDHPNVLPVYEAGERDGVLFMAMRYASGGDLRALLERQGPLLPARAVHVVAQVAAALDAAHAAGLLHRDVKTANVLVDDASAPLPHAYLADFGLVKRSSSQTHVGTARWVGTIDYVAPEQIRGDDIDGRADVYSLGCVLFELLTGRVPFEQDNDVSTLWAHIAESAPAVPEHVPSAQALTAVVQRALAKRPEDRYPTAGALAAAAHTALTNATDTRATPTGPTPSRAASTTSPGRPTPDPDDGAVPRWAPVPGVAFAALLLSTGFLAPGSDFDRTGEELARFYSEQLSAMFWVATAVHATALLCFVGYVYLLRLVLTRDGGSIAAEVTHRAFLVGVSLVLVTVVLTVLPAFRIAEDGDPRILKTIHDIEIFLSSLAQALLAVCFAAAALAARASPKLPRWLLWLAIALVPLAVVASAVVLTDARPVFLDGVLTLGLTVWVAGSSLTLLRRTAPGTARARAIHRTGRVRTGLVLMALLWLPEALLALSGPAVGHELLVVDALLAVLALALLVATWRGSPRAALPLLCLSPLLLARTVPVLMRGARTEEWIPAGILAGVITLAVLLVLPAARSRRGAEAQCEEAA